MKKKFVLLGIGLLIVLLGITYVYYLLHMNDWNKFFFQQYLNRIPGVTIKNMRMDGHRPNWIEINVKDKGDMEFFVTFPHSNLSLIRIGGCRFSSDDSIGNDIANSMFEYSNFIDLEPNSPFSELLNVKINNLSDLVKNYDNILTQVKKWPEKENSNNYVQYDPPYYGSGKYYYATHCE
ncbi:MAG TPA: hypothetical protein VL401_03460 [Alphaproteobacteria bacterium]|jgi:hypothetical protein|nr:hypothetical protein [Alphaproteobacteria bacterium]